MNRATPAANMDHEQPRVQPADGAATRKNKKAKKKEDAQQQEPVDASNVAVNTVVEHQVLSATQASPAEEALGAEPPISATPADGGKKKRHRPQKHPRKIPVVASQLARNNSSDQDQDVRLDRGLNPATVTASSSRVGASTSQPKPRLRFKLPERKDQPQAPSTASKEPLPRSSKARVPKRPRASLLQQHLQSAQNLRPKGYGKMSSPRNTDASSGFGSFSAATNTVPSNGFGSFNTSMSSQGPARPASPPRPAIEPLSPVMRPADSNMTGTGSIKSTDTSPSQPYASRTYKHTTQTPQTFVPQPPPQVIDFAENPDALALQSNIAILLMQKAKAEQNMRTLAQIKERAKANPAEFIKALKSGEIKTETRGGVFDPSTLESADDDDDDDDDDEDGVTKENADVSTAKTTKESDKPKDAKKSWPLIPARQDIIQVPSINWSQYGIMGESLDKLHQDQLKRPSEGKPAIIRPDGTIVPQEGGPRGNGGPIARPVGVGEGAEKSKRGGAVKK